jgi:hypothetical protein
VLVSLESAYMLRVMCIYAMRQVHIHAYAIIQVHICYHSSVVSAMQKCYDPTSISAFVMAMADAGPRVSHKEHL